MFHGERCCVMIFTWREIGSRISNEIIMKVWKRFLILAALVGLLALLDAACGDGDSVENAVSDDDGHEHAAVDVHGEAQAVATYVTNAAET